MALVYRYTFGHSNQAIPEFEKALELNRQMGITVHDSPLLYELSMAYCYVGNPEKGLALAEEALALAGDVPAGALGVDRRRENITHGWNAITLARFQLGDLDQVIQAGREALKAWGPAENQICGYVRLTMGLAHAMMGDLEEAKVELEAARKVAEEHAHPRLNGLCQHNLAVLAALQCLASDALAIGKEAEQMLAPMQLDEAPRAFCSAIRAVGVKDGASFQTALESYRVAFSNCPDIFAPEVLQRWAESQGLEMAGTPSTLS
jgi:tetratricopeptide (TPR) repeat protein